MLPRVKLEGAAGAELEGARAAGAEGSTGAAGWLAEAGVEPVAAVSAAVRGGEEVEAFGEYLKLVPVMPLEELGQAKILRIEVAAEVVARGKRDGRKHLAGVRPILAGECLIVLIHQADQIGPVEAAIEQRVAHAG